MSVRQQTALATPTARRGGRRLRLDPIACDGRGLCAELVPELIRLDDWGYPLLANEGEVPDHLEDVVRYAVDACPKLALRLERI